MTFYDSGRFRTTHVVWLLLALLLFTERGNAQNAFQPIQPGMAVATCFSGYRPGAGLELDNYVVGIIDVRQPPAAQIGRTWFPSMYHRADWTARNLGQIFGIALDDTGHIYVTATSSYGYAPGGPAGPGGIYKLNTFSGAISIFARLPNSGPGLGNICFDQKHRQFFVTNFEDGKIYRLDMQGNTVGMHDPFRPDNEVNGFAPPGERLWGIGIRNDTVYYGVWNQDLLQFTGPPNEVRSVALDAAGGFIPGSDRQEFTMPPMATNSFTFSNPVSDIAFSEDGRMLVAERSMYGDMQADAHVSRLFEYVGGSGNWNVPERFVVGNFDANSDPNDYRGPSCAGGTDYGYGRFDAAEGVNLDCSGAVWASGDALRYPGRNPDGGFGRVYGLARIPAEGNTIATAPFTSYYIDLNGDTINPDKTGVGDVEVFRTCRSAIREVCRGDSLRLTAQEGTPYKWEGMNLGCTGCPTPGAAPDDTTTYLAYITDAFGRTDLETVTVNVLPSATGIVMASGTQQREQTDPLLIAVPVMLDLPPDAARIERFILTISFQPDELFLSSSVTAWLQDATRDGLLNGWKTRVISAAEGRLVVEFTAPTGGEYLQGTGRLLTARFLPLLRDSALYRFSVDATIPDVTCISSPRFVDSLDYEICAEEYRHIELLPEGYALNGNSPNPFNPTTDISFSIGFDGPTRLEVFDARGRQVATLLDRSLTAGEHSVRWDADGFASGLYFYRITSSHWERTATMLLLK